MDQIKLLRRKNKFLLISLIVSLTILALIVFIESRDSSPIPEPENTDFHIISLGNGQIKDDGQTSLKDQIKVFNYGKPIHSIDIKPYVFLKLDTKCYSKTKEVLLKGFYTGSTYQYDHTTDQFDRTTDDKNLVLIMGGGAENNHLFKKISDEFYQNTGCRLQKTTYLKIEYEEDGSHIKHSEFYMVDNVNSSRIDNPSGENIINKSKNMSIIDLTNTNFKEISKVFGI